MTDCKKSGKSEAKLKANVRAKKGQKRSWPLKVVVKRTAALIKKKRKPASKKAQ